MCGLFSTVCYFYAFLHLQDGREQRGKKRKQKKVGERIWGCGWGGMGRWVDWSIGRGCSLGCPSFPKSIVTIEVTSCHTQIPKALPARLRIPSDPSNAHVCLHSFVCVYPPSISFVLPSHLSPHSLIVFAISPRIPNMNEQQHVSLLMILCSAYVRFF